MENNTPTTSKSAMNFGAMLGLVLMIFSLIIYVTEMYGSQWINWISTIILIAGIVIGIKKRRDNELGGHISYGSALGYGTLIALFASIITSVGSFLYLSYVDDGFIQFTLNTQETQLYENGLADEQIEMAMSMTKKFMTPGWIAFMAVLITVITGFIVSLIASAFLKKEASTFDEI
ncbi:MAG: DUF4199 domain-containing protein [Bacteroidetes bacterium]|nr:MAG: DUF4199 domain-containing protein [Bacteroidota bacterium]MBL1144389.1 DUF4199 domain-containing protein [Bacteroidota bacterium]MCB0801705.1 DUF4199 domain-containing protein [Flavobacteriales bacterium]NOG57185.1 DUF4199 domain-containing protein [Bacteroidota bacterium]